jgi:hypothetical protein
MTEFPKTLEANPAPAAFTDMFAVVSVEPDGAEKIIAMPMAPGAPAMPLVTTDMHQAARWASFCQSLSDKIKKPIRIINFVRGENMAECEPSIIKMPDEPQLIIP